MPFVGKELWYLPESDEFAETTQGGTVVPIPPAEVIYKAVYVTQPEGGPLEQARTRVATRDYQGREDIYLLRPTANSDGPPFRSVLIYRAAGSSHVERLRDPGRPELHTRAITQTQGRRYQALGIGSPFAWEQDLREGHPGYFLTGTSGTSALWRVTRVEADALDRQVLTLAPVRLPHALPMPNFAVVPDSTLRAYLEDQFKEFSGAVAAGAHFAAVDRAANLAEGVLAYCLEQIGRAVPERLANRLQAAKEVLDDKTVRASFHLTEYGYHLASTIRILHARLHENQVRKRGTTIRPEVGLGVATDMSELLVEVGLARY